MNIKITVSLVIFFLNSIFAMSWWDQTHIAVGTVAGFRFAYNLAAPDVAKLKAKEIEGYNHYCNLSESAMITPELVRSQIAKYNSPVDSIGHLYGAIVAAVRAYKGDLALGKFADYNLVYAGHYIGDLSMPLHSTEYNDFNRKYHSTIDGIIDNEISSNLNKIILLPFRIDSEDDLINLIVQIAKESKELGYQLQRENRIITKEEAYSRISESASLFKAVLEYVNYFK